MPSTAFSPAKVPARTSRTPAGRVKPVARFRVRITAGELIAIGPGKVILLEAVVDTGSITAAAKSLGMSYRRAWLLLDELNGALRRPAVDSAKGGQHGGGSSVTATGLELIALYRSIEATAAAACRADLKRLTSMIRR